MLTETTLMFLELLSVTACSPLRTPVSTHRHTSRPAGGCASWKTCPLLAPDCCPHPLAPHISGCFWRNMTCTETHQSQAPVLSSMSYVGSPLSTGSAARGFNL